MKPSDRMALLEESLSKSKPAPKKPKTKMVNPLKINQAFLDRRDKEIQANTKPHMMCRV